MSEIKTKAITANPQHEAMRNDLMSVINNHCSTMPTEEVLAVTCHLAGQITAMMNQRGFTPAMVIAIVEANIHAGNQSMVQGLKEGVAGHA